MKKLLLCLIAIASFAFASKAEQVTFDATAQGYSNAQDMTTNVLDDYITLTWAKGSNKNNGPKYYTGGTAIRLYGGNTVTIAATDAVITHITLIGNDNSNCFKEESTFDCAGTVNIQKQRAEWDGESTSVTFQQGGTNGNARITKIEVTYTINSSTPSAVARPTIAVDESRDNTYVVACETEGATLTYSIDGGEFVDYNANDGIVITGDCTIVARATLVEDSAESTLPGKLNAGTLAQFISINDLGRSVKITEPLTVTAANGSTIYVTAGDAYGALRAMNQAKNGNVIAAGVRGTLGNYNGITQINDAQLTDITDGEALAPTEMTIAEINANLSSLNGHYVIVKHVEVEVSGNQVKIKDGSGDVTLYKFIVTEFESMAQATVIGIVCTYNSKSEILAVSVTEEEVEHEAGDITVTIDGEAYTGDLSEGLTAGLPYGTKLTFTSKWATSFEVAIDGGDTTVETATDGAWTYTVTDDALFNVTPMIGEKKFTDKAVEVLIEMLPAGDITVAVNGKAYTGDLSEGLDDTFIAGSKLTFTSQWATAFEVAVDGGDTTVEAATDGAWTYTVATEEMLTITPIVGQKKYDDKALLVLISLKPDVACGEIEIISVDGQIMIDCEGAVTGSISVTDLTAAQAEPTVTEIDAFPYVYTPSRSGVYKLDVTATNASGLSTVSGSTNFYNEIAYELVSDQSQVVAGESYIIVTNPFEKQIEGAENAMGTFSNSSFLCTGVAIVGNIATPASDATIITLEAAADGKWNLKVGDKYIASSGKNNVTLSETPTAASITIEDSRAIVSFSESNRIMLNKNSNNNNPMFRNYANGNWSNKDFKAISLYRAVVGKTEVFVGNLQIATSIDELDNSGDYDGFVLRADLTTMIAYPVIGLTSKRVMLNDGKSNILVNQEIDYLPNPGEKAQYLAAVYDENINVITIGSTGATTEVEYYQIDAYQFENKISNVAAIDIIEVSPVSVSAANGVTTVKALMGDELFTLTDSNYEVDGFEWDSDHSGTNDMSHKLGMLRLVCNNGKYVPVMFMEEAQEVNENLSFQTSTDARSAVEFDGHLWGMHNVAVFYTKDGSEPDPAKAEFDEAECRFDNDVITWNWRVTHEAGHTLGTYEYDFDNLDDYWTGRTFYYSGPFYLCPANLAQDLVNRTVEIKYVVAVHPAAPEAQATWTSKTVLTNGLPTATLDIEHHLGAAAGAPKRAAAADVVTRSATHVGAEVPVSAVVETDEKFEITTGAIDVLVPAAQSTTTEWYNLQGMRVSADALTPGIYICRKGQTVDKVVVR